MTTEQLEQAESETAKQLKNEYNEKDNQFDFPEDYDDIYDN